MHDGAVKIRLRLAAVHLAAATVLALAACGGAGQETGEDTGEAAGAGTSVEESTDHNQADVTFASEMIPHHAQALVMTDMTAGRELDKELTALVEDIRAAQAPEIELMVDWLQEWGEPVPETVRDHAHGGHDGDSGDPGDMPAMDGMMSEQQLGELEGASGTAFEELWLEMMVEHHEGAVAMAETELAEGSFQPALDLAGEIAASQSDEIALMERLLEE